MLKVNKIRESQKISINYDAYIPLEIKFGDWDLEKESTQYWRTGDFQKSLIEIGLGEKKKEIRSITLIMCNNVSQTKTNCTQTDNITIGCPVLTLERPNTDIYIDEKGFLSVQLFENSLSILFDTIQPRSIIKNNEVEFLLNNENQCIGFRVQNIDALNMNILRETLRCSN